MRKVMSRLVTVEQAARMAGVDPDDLVSRLNAHVAAATGESVNTGGGEAMSMEESAPTAHVAGASALDGEATADRPAALSAIPADCIVALDVREELRMGREPFSLIMAARRQVPEGGALSIRATFEPVPLYAVMARQGLQHWTEEIAGDDWLVWFYPAESPAGGTASPAGVRGSAAGPAPRAAEPARPETGPDVSASQAEHASGERDIVILDVRGLEPPEPMERTLAALEELPAGSTLLQINVRIPQFLLPLLEQRGFTYEIREQEAGLVRVFIRHSN